MSYPPYGPPQGLQGPPQDPPPYHDYPPWPYPYPYPQQPHGDGTPYQMPMPQPIGLPQQEPGQIPYFMPATMMIPVPFQEASQPTYITNYIYHGESSNNAASNRAPEPEAIEKKPEPNANIGEAVETGDFEWVPTTSTLANNLIGRAVVAGHEGWDGSPLWVIRANHNGEKVPGKLSVRHLAASIPYRGKEVPVQNIEVLCSNPAGLRWVPASDGDVPPSAIAGGRTGSGESIYIGRARYQLSLTPGKVQPDQRCCLISFGGAEVAVKMYDVLCRVS